MLKHNSFHVLSLAGTTGNIGIKINAMKINKIETWKVSCQKYIFYYLSHQNL